MIDQDFIPAPPPRSPLAMPLARMGMRVAGPFLNPAVKIVLMILRKRHPALFRMLEEMDTASLIVQLTDIPRRFCIDLGGGQASIRTARKDEQTATVKITGTLEALLDILEGKSDGDALFFSRGIVLTGNSAPIVALRNILDSENINLLDEALSLLGPLAPPAHRAWQKAGCIGRKIANIRARKAGVA